MLCHHIATLAQNEQNKYWLWRAVFHFFYFFLLQTEDKKRCETTPKVFVFS